MNTPTAPDPYATADAQTKSNEQTAQYQQSLNQTNQITPYGSISYAQTGTGADGAPITTATTSLAPSVQNLVDSNVANNTAESGIAGQLANNASSQMSQPLNLGPSALQAQMDQENRATLDPQWAELGEQNAQQTYDQGLAPGSQGYAQNQNTFNNARNSAYNSMYVADEGAAQNALTQQYNEPLNALSALQSGSQIAQPGVGTTAASPQTSVAGTNISGLIEQNYQDQLASSNATMGGLFGLGGTLGSAAIKAIPWSDRRLKKDVSRLGTSRDGLPIYAYRYVWGGEMRAGPMAQDVEKLYPDAVFDMGGFLAIDFARMPA